MFVRTDLTDRGDAGPLLVSLITFMLDDGVQNTFLPALGFSPLPPDVRRYAVERALPLLQVDTQARAWSMEMGATLTNGEGARGGKRFRECVLGPGRNDRWSVRDVGWG